MAKKNDWKNDPLYFGSEEEPTKTEKKKELRDRLEFEAAMDQAESGQGND